MFRLKFDHYIMARAPMAYSWTIFTSMEGWLEDSLLKFGKHGRWHQNGCDKCNMTSHDIDDPSFNEPQFWWIMIMDLLIS
jgi:hypothetical protein